MASSRVHSSFAIIVANTVSGAVYVLNHSGTLSASLRNNSALTSSASSLPIS